VKAVADTLGVARSHLAERLSRPVRPRGLYHKPEDARLLLTIRAIVDARPSYGYRRVTALVNRALRSRGEASVNAKRVLRILRANGLTLAPHTARRPGRTHDGIVVALRSNVERVARITSNCAAGTVRSSACCLPSTRATARSWRGRRPRQASRPRWSAT
jgi:HTH-like domain